MKILVTGGAGFIGSALIRHIIQKTQDIVINVDKLTYAGNLEALTTVASNSRYFFELADICDRSKIDNIFHQYQPDAVMHLAAESHVDRSINGAAAFIETNIVGTYVLLESARNYWEQLPQGRKQSFRFHHVSTDEVYGDLENTDSFFTENTPYSPSNPYSASKASSDHLVRSWYRTYGLPILLSHSSNNYGYYQFPEKLIPLTIANALQGKPLPIYGNGLQIRDWLFVDDHVQALYRIVTKGRIGETYNIGGCNEKTNMEVVRTICQLLEELAPNKPHGVIKYENLITHVEDRPGHDIRYATDVTKISEELGWEPQEMFATGIRKTVEWYLHNPLFLTNTLQDQHITSNHKQNTA